MRPTQCFLMSLATVCAASGALGCTVYTSPPPRVRASVGVGVRAERPPTQAPTTIATPPRTIDIESYSVFHDALAPYGQWVDASVCGGWYGAVWRPSAGVVGPDFVPYATGGQWVATDQGWSFVTDWDWGWAAFHYGRWCPDPRLGWVWVPGTEWASAWVDWRFGGGYVGWAPLPPAGIALRDENWVFVDAPSFAGRRAIRFGLPPERAIEARRVTRPHRRVVHGEGHSWSAGPPPSEIRLYGGAEVRPVHVAPPARGKVRRVIVRPRH